MFFFLFFLFLPPSLRLPSSSPPRCLCYLFLYLRQPLLVAVALLGNHHIVANASFTCDERIVTMISQSKENGREEEGGGLKRGCIGQESTKHAADLSSRRRYSPFHRVLISCLK